jgi:hypothetical protein
LLCEHHDAARLVVEEESAEPQSALPLLRYWLLRVASAACLYCLCVMLHRISEQLLTALFWMHHK